MAETYIPMVLMIVISFGLGSALVLVSVVLGPKYPSEIKDYPFECGHLIETDATHRRHSVKFYMLAIVFLLFDIEIVFIYPWAKIFRSLGALGLVEMFIFLGILLVGYLYIWKKGVLTWD